MSSIKTDIPISILSINNGDKYYNNFLKNKDEFINKYLRKTLSTKSIVIKNLNNKKDKRKLSDDEINKYAEYYLLPKLYLLYSKMSYYYTINIENHYNVFYQSYNIYRNMQKYYLSINNPYIKKVNIAINNKQIEDDKDKNKNIGKIIDIFKQCDKETITILESLLQNSENEINEFNKILSYYSKLEENIGVINTTITDLTTNITEIILKNDTPNIKYIINNNLSFNNNINNIYYEVINNSTNITSDNYGRIKTHNDRISKDIENNFNKLILEIIKFNILIDTNINFNIFYDNNKEIKILDSDLSITEFKKIITAYTTNLNTNKTNITDILKQHSLFKYNITKNIENITDLLDEYDKIISENKEIKYNKIKDISNRKICILEYFINTDINKNSCSNPIPIPNDIKKYTDINNTYNIYSINLLNNIFKIIYDFNIKQIIFLDKVIDKNTTDINISVKDIKKELENSYKKYNKKIIENDNEIEKYKKKINEKILLVDQKKTNLNKNKPESNRNIIIKKSYLEIDNEIIKINDEIRKIDAEITKDKAKIAAAPSPIGSPLSQSKTIEDKIEQNEKLLESKINILATKEKEKINAYNSEIEKYKIEYRNKKLAFNKKNNDIILSYYKQILQIKQEKIVPENITNKLNYIKLIETNIPIIKKETDEYNNKNKIQLLLEKNNLFNIFYYIKDNELVDKVYLKSGRINKVTDYNTSALTNNKITNPQRKLELILNKLVNAKIFRTSSNISIPKNKKESVNYNDDFIREITEYLKLNTKYNISSFLEYLNTIDLKFKNIVIKLLKEWKKYYSMKKKNKNKLLSKLLDQQKYTDINKKLREMVSTRFKKQFDEITEKFSKKKIVNNKTYSPTAATTTAATTTATTTLSTTSTISTTASKNNNNIHKHTSTNKLIYIFPYSDFILCYFSIYLVIINSILFYLSEY